MSVATAIWRATTNPIGALVVMRMRLAGLVHRLRFRLRGQRVQCGRNFRVRGPFHVSGPGLVIFGDDCTVVGSRLNPVTPFTHSDGAVIRIGDRVVLNGTRFGCQQHIEIGEGSLLADCRIMDTDFHDLEPRRTARWNTTGIAKPVTIGPNVWVCAGSMVLKGVTIGANSVVGAGTVVTRDVPANAVVAGNPARIVKRLGEEPPPRRRRGVCRPARTLVERESQAREA